MAAKTAKTEDVRLVALDTVQHDGETYVAGDEFTAKPKQAEALIEAKVAEPVVTAAPAA